MPEVAELTPTEFHRRWPNPARHDDMVLLDVREPDELEFAAVREARHMPMREVPERLAEIPRDKSVVVMCHGGGRSLRVAQFLVASGYERVFNLRGGIDAWSQEVDQNIPRY